MFSNFPHPLDDVLDWAIIASGLVFVLSYAWSQWRKGKSTADSDTITTYQNEMNILKEKVQRLEDENKKYTASLNQLIGENKTLKELLTYQDPTFRAKMDEIYHRIVVAPTTLGEDLYNAQEAMDKDRKKFNRKKEA